MSDVGGILYDKDTTMLDIGQTTDESSQHPRHALLRDLKELDGIDEAESRISLFGGGSVLAQDDVNRIVSTEKER